MSKHTLGPWKCDERSGCVAVYSADEHYECLSGAHKWAIYFASGSQKENLFWEMDEKEVAKARLIAAAPELLEMLEMMVAMCKSIGGFENGVEWNGKDEGAIQAERLIEKAEETISKAKG